MIATPTDPETCEYKSKFSPSPDREKVRNQSGQPKQNYNYEPKSDSDPTCESTNPEQIDGHLKRFADSGLWGIDYVSAYLRNQHRRECRPSTLRSSFAAIYHFLTYLKKLSQTCLDTVVREDLASFIEHEQDVA